MLQHDPVHDHATIEWHYTGETKGCFLPFWSISKTLAMIHISSPDKWISKMASQIALQLEEWQISVGLTYRLNKIFKWTDFVRSKLGRLIKMPSDNSDFEGALKQPYNVVVVDPLCPCYLSQCLKNPWGKSERKLERKRMSAWLWSLIQICSLKIFSEQHILNSVDNCVTNVWKMVSLNKVAIEC